MKIGILREEKIPADERVPFTPDQCKWILDNTDVKLVVRSSEVRGFSDKEYSNLGIKVVEDLSDCDVLIGIKEVPKSSLIKNKMYFYFSHTIKKQAYNRSLLQKMVEKNIRMIDYEIDSCGDGTYKLKQHFVLDTEKVLRIQEEIFSLKSQRS